MNERNVTKNQHYIPEFIIRKFSFDGRHVFEALIEKRLVYQTSCRSSMSERYIYEHSKFKTNELENLFAKALDDPLNAAYQEISNSIKNYKLQITSFDSVKSSVESHMLTFLNGYYRSRALLQEFSQFEQIKEDRIIHMLQRMMNQSYMNRLAKTIIKYYKLAVLESDNLFLLSDQFMATAALGIKSNFSNVTNRHIGMKEVIILIPISRSFYLAYFNGKVPVYIKEDRVNTVKPYQIGDLNQAIANNSYKKLVGSSRDEVEKVLHRHSPQSPMQVTAYFKSGMATRSVLKKEVFFYESDRKKWDLFNTHSWIQHKGLVRNSTCFCGSGKKFKKCCMDAFIGSERIINSIKDKQNTDEFKVNTKATVERGIEESFYAGTPTETQIQDS